MACGLEIKPGCKVTLEIKGDVKFKGGINEDGIRVHPTAELTITGAGNLYCSGNNEKEGLKLNKALLGLYYGTEGFDPSNPQATDRKNLSADAQQAFDVYDSTGGSGIGYAQHATGKINIIGLGKDTEGHPALKIIAKGYGKGAFGIGGGDTEATGDEDKPNLILENVEIEEARGGYSTIHRLTTDNGINSLEVVETSDADRFIYEDKVVDLSYYTAYADNDIKVLNYTSGGNPASVYTYINEVIRHPASTFKVAPLIQQGKYEAEGGCAIGVRSGISGTGKRGYLSLKDVRIKKAVGGSKAAAIGGSFWSAAKISVENSTISNVTGGNGSAGIGGSRFHWDPTFNVTSDTEIYINDTGLSNIKGGQFAAAIGSGYNTYTRDLAQTQNCIIRIDSDAIDKAESKTTLSGIKGGMAAAGIGTGYHQSRLEGYISPMAIIDSASSVKAGDNWADLDYSNIKHKNDLVDLTITAPGILNKSGTADATYLTKYFDKFKAKLDADGNLSTSGDHVSLSGEQRGFAYYADNKYGTLSKPQAIGYGCLYTHGVNIENNQVMGRECLDSSDRPAAVADNKLNKHPDAFVPFTSSVQFESNEQTIDNPRLLANNLSRHSDAPANWVEIRTTSELNEDNAFVIPLKGIDEYEGAISGKFSINGVEGITDADLADRFILEPTFVQVPEGTPLGATADPHTYAVTFVPDSFVVDLERGEWSGTLYVGETGGKNVYDVYLKLTAKLKAAEEGGEDELLATFYQLLG
jgi:hypothetical protein